MPIEIKELHINVTIDATAQTPNAVGPAAAGGNASVDKDAIIAECVDQVLQILQNKKER